MICQCVSFDLNLLHPQQISEHTGETACAEFTSRSIRLTAAALKEREQWQKRRAE